MIEIFGVPWEPHPAVYPMAITATALAIFSFIVGRMTGFTGRGKWYAIHGGAIGLNYVVALVANGFAQPLTRDHILDAEAVAVAPDGVIVAIAITTAASAATSVLWIIGIHGLTMAHGAPRFMLPAGIVALIELVSRVLIAPESYTDMGRPVINVVESMTSIGFVGVVGSLMVAPIVLCRQWLADRETAQALMAVALGLFPTIFMGGNLFRHSLEGVWFAPIWWTGSAFFVVVSIAWWVAALRTDSSVARRTAFTFSAMYATAIAFAVSLPVVPLQPVVFTLEILIIGYAIMRFGAFGLQPRLRWGISKTTVAALFIAVFFVVSEFAAATFSDRWGTEIGIAAAGLLVFAIAPIMKWADRLAAGAVPLPQGSDAETIFRNSLRVALKDGIIDPEEESALAEQADRLGISAGRVLALRREVEA